ncbi:2-C-methyl-D-erythritol 2,4-cyclodiphosphate synthase [Coprothermobacter platensis]|uniref:2-C-methyl-D-erythritol 2,4-cyclodiphosphate synthase n=1 Tax=Coprothermobacter platensis TaxID=108819 RepID=UPI00035C56D3|nr:2-C-methyl-D-erythritol 2,4-cyclodiphosphate synthase [Coprothermobacter platensis]
MNGLILVAGGKGQRFSGGRGKASLPVFHGYSLLDYWELRLPYLKQLFAQIVIVSDEQPKDKSLLVAPPGLTRKESVKNGFALLSDVDKVVIHDAARPLASDDLFERVLAWLDIYPVVVPVIDIEDALRKMAGEESVPLSRNGILRVQTPQGFTYEALSIVMESSNEDVDEASVAQDLGFKVHTIEGERKNLKVTFPGDIFIGDLMFEKTSGIGWDFHRFDPSCPLILGGVQITDSVVGLKSWTDGDVVIHAVAESILSMIGKGDLGTLFPNNETWENKPSTDILNAVLLMAKEMNITVSDVSVLLLADQPRLGPWLKLMENHLSSILNAKVHVSVTHSENVFGKPLDGIVCVSFTNAFEVKL